MTDMAIIDCRLELALAKVGRRGTLVIPAGERRRAGISEGDRVEVKVEEEGTIMVRKIPSLERVRKRMSGRLPQWDKLEGRADQLILKQVKAKHGK
jgi:AbrB family looped-hinge helix DNA binding protein